MKKIKQISFIFFILNFPFFIFAKPMLLRFKVFPFPAQILINNQELKPQIKETELSYLLLPGTYQVQLKALGYQTKTLTLDFKKPLFIEEKLEKNSSFAQFKKEFFTGSQPKSIYYTPQGDFLIIPLLEGLGAQVFCAKTFNPVKLLSPPTHFAKQKGFVEVAFLNQRQEIWVSQMTANQVHIFDLKTFDYKHSIFVQGHWPKIITPSLDEERVFVSNWVSQDVSVLCPKTKKVLKTIKTQGIPRGMALSPHNEFLYIALFSTGKIEKINLANYQKVKTLDFGKGAKRHLIFDYQRNILYASDMQRGSVFMIDGKTDKLMKEIIMDHKINTIQLTSDGNLLVASSRGPNGKKGYLYKSHEFGKVYFVCPHVKRVIHWFWGKNQPTGLALSPIENQLVYTNFLDYQAEVYHFSPFYLGYWQYAFAFLPLALY